MFNKLVLLLLSILLFQGYTWFVTLSPVLRPFVSLFDIILCVKKLLHFALKSYYILRQKLLHFALMLHFASIVTFCGVTSSNADMDERLTARSCSNNKLIFEDLYSFIEAKVKQVCRFEIENLKSEASASYANELVITAEWEQRSSRQIAGVASPTTPFWNRKLIRCVKRTGVF